MGSQACVEEIVHAPHATALAQVAVHDEPYFKGQFDLPVQHGNKVPVSRPQLNLHPSDASTSAQQGDLGEVVVAAYREAGQQGINPPPLEHRRHMVIANQVMSLQFIRRGRKPAAPDIGLVGEQPDRDVADLSRHQLLLRGPHHADSDVSLALQQVFIPV